MMSAPGLPARLLQNAQDVYQGGLASLSASISAYRAKAAYLYQPLDPDGLPAAAAETATATATATATGDPPAQTTKQRGPLTLLQTRWGKLLLAAVLLVLLCLAAVVADVPAAVSSLAQKPDEPLTAAARRAALTKDEYIAAVLRNPVEGELDPAPIRALCDATVFREGLVWHCELVNGGIGNVGNMWLNCVRYAIEAGATTIILPRIGARSEDDLGDLGDDAHSADLDTLFDVDYFLRRWPEACPQMRAVRSGAEVPNLPPVQESPAIRANQIGKLARIKEFVVDPTGWRDALDAWLDAHVPAAAGNMSAAAPLRVRQRIALSNWNREAHAPDFVRAFPRLFRFPEQPRRLAAAVLWSLENSTGRPAVSDAVLFPDLAAADEAAEAADEEAADEAAGAAAGAVARRDGDPVVPLVTALGRGRLAAGGFQGVHLRVAEDAAQAHWPGYDAQAPAYLDEAAARNLSVVYLATGSAAHRDRFRADAAARHGAGDGGDGLRVLTKEDLLDEEARAELGGLAWDQQAIVDYEVLVHSSHFAGFVRSSFSWWVAVRRGLLPEAGVPVVTRRQRRAVDGRAVDGRAGVVEKYRDGLSVVVGRYDAMTIMGIWP